MYLIIFRRVKKPSDNQLLKLNLYNEFVYSAGRKIRNRRMFGRKVSFWSGVSRLHGYDPSILQNILVNF